MALPGSASAVTGCPYGSVYTSGGVGGNAAAGVCVDAAGFGGYAEVGNGGSYGVIDGSDNNPANSAGYAGFSTGTNATSPGDSSKDSSCNGADTASPSYNSGGCFWFKGAGPVPAQNLTVAGVTSLFICGNTSGPDWETSTRDGCSIP